MSTHVYIYTLHTYTNNKQFNNNLLSTIVKCFIGGSSMNSAAQQQMHILKVLFEEYFQQNYIQAIRKKIKHIRNAIRQRK